MSDHTGMFRFGHSFALSQAGMIRMMGVSGEARQKQLEAFLHGADGGFYCTRCGMSLKDVTKVIALMKIDHATSGIAHTLVCVSRPAAVRAIQYGLREATHYEALAVENTGAYRKTRENLATALEHQAKAKGGIYAAFKRPS